MEVLFQMLSLNFRRNLKRKNDELQNRKHGEKVAELEDMLKFYKQENDELKQELFKLRDK